MILGAAGVAHEAMGSYAKAAEAYTQALALARELGDRARECAVLGDLGNAVEAQGKYDEAIGHYRAALGAARALGDARAGAQMRRYLEGAAEAKAALRAADEACYAQARILIDSP